MTWTEPSLPPLLNARAVVRGGDPCTLALAGVESRDLGAGDALWLQDPATAEIAIILEPDIPLNPAVQMLPLGVAAAGDSLATLTPPQVGVQYRWPATLLLNGAAAGELRLIAPAHCQPEDMPAWLVLHYRLRHAFPEDLEPGAVPGITSLVEEGGDELTTADVLASFARHFLSHLDGWQSDGFQNTAQNWQSRLEGRETAAAGVISHPQDGHPLGLDEDGNLLLKQAAGAIIARPLIDCIIRKSSIGGCTS